MSSSKIMLITNCDSQCSYNALSILSARLQVVSSHKVWQGNKTGKGCSKGCEIIDDESLEIVGKSLEVAGRLSRQILAGSF